MSCVNKSQVERARLVSVLEYILRYEHDNAKRVGTQYRLRDHDSLSVSEEGWFWHSQGIGGQTALDFLTSVRGYGFVDAVCLLLGEQPAGRNDPDQHEHMTSTQSVSEKSKTQRERLPFALPRRNDNNRRVVAYLQSRGIDKCLIQACIKRGDLYESANNHECVFKGRDETGKTRYAAIRSTTTNFKRDADGSDKKYSFLLPPDDLDSTDVAVFESPIDALSHQTICLRGYLPPFDGWRLSLGGTSIFGLEHFLEHHPQIAHCTVLTDDDEAGNRAADRIAEMQGVTTERLFTLIGNDWNDALQDMLRAERTKNRANSHAHEGRG